MKLEITDLEPVDIVLEDILKTNPLYSLKVQYDDREGWCLSLIDNAWPNYVSITSGKTLVSAAQKMRNGLIKKQPEDKDLALRVMSRDKAFKLSCEEICSMLLAIRENWRFCSHEIMPRLQAHGTWNGFLWILACRHVILNNEGGRKELQTLLGDCPIVHALPKSFQKREISIGILNAARIWLLGYDQDGPHLLWITKDQENALFRSAIEACATWIELHEDKENQQHDQERA